MVRILLADDHSVVRVGLRGLIEAQTAWEVCGEAATGQEAVSLSGQLQPDVAVLDLTMPDLDGIEATRQIRQRSPRTRVLIYTMHRSDQLARSCIAAGAEGVLVKSDGVDQLIPSVAALLDDRLVFSASISGKTASASIDPKETDGTGSSGRVAVKSLPASFPLPGRTKFVVPQRHPLHVTRPRLLDRMRLSPHHRVVLVVAPAGYGKTTLLVDWLATQRPPTAWLTLDGEDNDPARFCQAISTALQSLSPGIAGIPLPFIPPNGDCSPEVVVSALLDGVSDRSMTDGGLQPAFLILDDYHVIRNRAVTEIMARVMECLLPQLKLIIISRVRPALPLERLRTNQELVEVRAADLAFSQDEVERFVREVMSLSLTREELAAITARTEGWPAALHLLRLSLQGAPDPSQMVARFGGSNRHIVDYLIEQVLTQQPLEVQIFLLHTCVLDRMCAPLCEALLPADEVPASPSALESKGGVLQRREFQAMLEGLEASSFFVTSLDQEGQWYRYHQLFADALRHRLHLDHPDIEAVLHVRASRWYEQESDFAEAIRQAALAEDWERVTRLLETGPRPVEGTAEYLAWERWTKLVSHSALRLHPNLAVNYIVDLWLKQWLDEARLALTDLEEIWADKGDSVPSETDASFSGVPRSRVEALQAMIGGLALQDADEASTLAQRAVEHLEPDDAFYRAAVLYAWSMTLHYHERLREALSPLSGAVSLAEQAGRTHLYLRSLDLYAHLLADTGDLMAASVIVQKARVCFQSTSEDDSLLPIPEFTASYIAYQRDELEEARRSCLHAIQAARQHEAWPWEMKAHVFLSDVYRARHNTEGALRELNEADILMRDRVSQTRARGHRLLDAISARRAWIAIAQGERGAAAGWRAHASSIDAERASLTSWIDRPVLTVTVRAFLLDGHTDQVMAFLTPLLARAEAAGAGEAYLGLLVLWALVQVAAGKHDRALQELAAALRLSAPQQNRRFFLDEGKQMPALLHAALQHQALDLPTRRFTRDLLTRFSSSAAPARRVEPTHPDLVEALSDREREILRLVASGLSNQEIADQLIVELSTVKWYITSIHGKLGVGRRTQAVARGRELGLLP